VKGKRVKREWLGAGLLLAALATGLLGAVFVPPTSPLVTLLVVVIIFAILESFMLL